MAKADSCILFQRSEIDFVNIHQYLKNYTKSGDWFIPLGGHQCLENRLRYATSIDDYAEYITRYDDQLMKIYRHQDTDIVLKNIKRLGDKDSNHKGLIFNIISAIEKIDKLAEKLPKRTVQNFAEKAKKAYDGKFTDKFTNTRCDITIWIPVWRTKSDKAILVEILDRRVNILIT